MNSNEALPRVSGSHPGQHGLINTELLNKLLVSIGR